VGVVVVQTYHGNKHKGIAQTETKNGKTYLIKLIKLNANHKVAPTSTK
jgi:hypothetical protein